jgi:hypothetical protein
MVDGGAVKKKRFKNLKCKQSGGTERARFKIHYVYDKKKIVLREEKQCSTKIPFAAAPTLVP